MLNDGLDVLEDAKIGHRHDRTELLRRSPSLVGDVELEVVELEVGVHPDVASADAKRPRELEREVRRAGLELLAFRQRARCTRRERTVRADVRRRAEGRAECERGLWTGHHAERRGKRRSGCLEGAPRVAAEVLFLVLAVLLVVLADVGTEIRIRDRRLIEVGEDEVTGDADVEPSREAEPGRERRVDERRARLHEIVARRRRLPRDAERERPIADRRRTEDACTDREAIEVPEVGRQREERREERPRDVRHQRIGSAAPWRLWIVGVVGERADALELEGVDEEVAVGEEVRAPLAREARGVVIDGRPVAGLGDERRPTAHRLRAVVGDLEATRGSRGRLERDRSDDRRSKEVTPRRLGSKNGDAPVHGSTLTSSGAKTQ